MEPISPRAAAALLALALGAAAPGRADSPVTPRESRTYQGRDRAEARLRDLYGVARLRLAGLERLEDQGGGYLSMAVEVANFRSEELVLEAGQLGLRLPDGTWLAPEGVADRPPLAGWPRRPALASRAPVRIPRDDRLVVYASFRTEVDRERVDPVVVVRDEPLFLRRPLRADRGGLVRDALGMAERGRIGLARGILAECAGKDGPARDAVGRRLLEAAEIRRRDRRPVEEDRILRLALPYAPNPAWVHGRLAELRQEVGRRYPSEGRAPPPRDWSYHRRRAERLAPPPVPTGPAPGGEP